MQARRLVVFDPTLSIDPALRGVASAERCLVQHVRDFHEACQAVGDGALASAVVVASVHDATGWELLAGLRTRHPNLKIAVILEDVPEARLAAWDLGASAVLSRSGVPLEAVILRWGVSEDS